MSTEPDFFSRQVSRARRFYLDLSPSPAKALAVVSAGCEHCAPDYSINRPGFPYLVVEYVADGEGEVILDGATWRLLPGTVFSYGPKIAHAISTSSANTLIKYFVDFAGTRSKTLLHQVSLDPGRVMQTARTDQVMAVFDFLVEEGVSESRFSASTCSAILEFLLLKIGSVAIPYGAGETRAFRTYRRARRFIQQHYLELRSVKEVATACHIDHPYLCRLFKRFDHLTPYQYLVRLKMNRAAQMLQEAGKLVKEVAEDLHFSDPYHFSRVFKRVYGVSPERLVRRNIAVEE